MTPSAFKRSLSDKKSPPGLSSALAALWWMVLVLRGVLPVLFAVAMGALVGAVQRGAELSQPIAFVGAIFW